MPRRTARCFASADTGRVVALIVALAQPTYALAPAAFGLTRDLGGSVLMLAVAAQLLAVVAFLGGRRRKARLCPGPASCAAR